MASAIQNVAGVFARAVLSLRYRVRVVGLDKIDARQGVLLLPNHPAYTDPALVISHVWSTFAPRPMLLASVFENPLLFWLPRALGALKVPDLARASAEARKQTEESITAIAEGLQGGENFILWPSGRVQRGEREVLGSARSVSAILEQAPDVKLVLIRTRGLRGSMFSYARTGSAPNLTTSLLKGVGLVLANLLFLTPRREIEITVEEVDRESLPDTSREELNPYLEAWYEQPGLEQPKHVPYHFLFGARDFEFPVPTERSETEYEEVGAKTRKQIAQVLRQKVGASPRGDLDDPATELEALGMDSLDRMELSLELEDRFGFRSAEVPDTVGDLWSLAEGGGGNAAEIKAPAAWLEEPPRTGPAELAGDTILEALLLRAADNSKAILAADDLSGTVTYERFLVAVQAFARQLRIRIPAPNVGILLPASVATDILIFATHQAGKTPVLVNWTTGPGNLAHAARTMGLTHLVSSRRFVDRMGITIEGTEYVYLEELRETISKLELLWLLLRTRFMPGSLLRRMPKASVDDPAVVLFTSGSEKAPKAVPLSHKNILSNLQSVLDGYEITRSDVVLGFLPPFHSFGFTVTVMLPILTGARVVHHPDPTEARALAHKLHAFSATILGATPTFLGYVLRRSTREDLATLRLAVVGGEKCPDALFDDFEQMAPTGHLIEGYGVTECSPLVSCGRPGGGHRGTLGRPLPAVEVLVVDPDSREPLPTGEVGMLLVKGRNVFEGYLEYDGPSPFHELNGERWYVTGDLALEDATGVLHFRGRLKRFLKFGGEMVSLPAIEEPLAQRFPPSDQGPRVAVEGIDEPKRYVVLFTVEPISLKDANAVLVESGLRGVMRFDEVREVDAIPVLGTGKIDYKVLRQQLQEAAQV